VSVGHVQRAIESAGIPTVGVYVSAFGHVPAQMGVARALITPHPMGRPMGAPGDAERHLAVVRQALSLLERDADQVIESFPDGYRPHFPTTV
jgi:hypothetical protein